jgi:hypothetical protein
MIGYHTDAGLRDDLARLSFLHHGCAPNKAKLAIIYQWSSAKPSFSGRAKEKRAAAGNRLPALIDMGIGGRQAGRSGVAPIV